MRAHHERAIQRITEHFEQDPNYLALIFGGSIAKGLERADSDVDAVLVGTDDHVAQLHAERRYWVYSTDFTDYEGGYFDAKLVDLRFLLDLAERGSDPARSAFEHSWIGFYRIEGLDLLLQRIAVYPEHDHGNRLEAFYGQMMAMEWFVGEAEKRGDRYLLTHAVGDLVLFSARLILAQNRMLYPYHKWLMTYVDKAPNKPADYQRLVKELLDEPTKERASRVVASVAEFSDWGLDSMIWVPRFFEDVEWTWRYGKPGIEDW